MRRLIAELLVRLSLALPFMLCAAAADAPADEWGYKGDGLIVKLHEKDGAHAGTVTLGGKTYPFTGKIKDGVLAGTFNAGDEKFAFTLKTTAADAKRAVFETGGTKYNVAESDPAALREAPAEPNPPVPAPMPNAPAPDPAPVPDPAPAVVADNGVPRRIVLEKRAVHDQKTNLDISTVLIPRGWEFRNETLWRLTLMQWVAAYVEAVDPRTGTAVRWLPADQFSGDPTLYQQAQRQGGPMVTFSGYELSPKALDAEQYVTEVAIPRYRKVDGLKVIGSADVPWLQREVEQNMAQTIASAKQNGFEIGLHSKRVRVEYRGPDGKAIEEDVYCTVSHSWSPQMVAMARQVGLPGTVNFQSQRLFSLSAPTGKLDAMTPLLQAIADSARATPQWEVFVMNIERMRRQAAINDANLINTTRVEITDQQRQEWLQRQEAQDRIAQGRGDNLSGIHRFVEPTDPSARVIVPQAWGRAFSDGQGHYVLTNDPLYQARQDPNLSGNWQEMQPQGR